MISNMKRNKNLIASMTKKVEKSVAHANNVWRPSSGSRGNNSFYYFPFVFSLSAYFDKGIRAVENSKGVVYFGVDRNNFSVRLHRDYSQNKNPANEPEVEAIDLMMVFARNFRDRNSSESPLRDLLPKLAPYPIEAFVDHPELVKKTEFYSELLNAVRTIQSKLTWEVEIRDGNWPTLKNPPIIPVAWVDLDKGAFSWYRDKWSESYRQGVETCSINNFMESKDASSIFVPVYLFSLWATCPYYSNKLCLW